MPFNSHIRTEDEADTRKHRRLRVTRIRRCTHFASLLTLLLVFLAGNESVAQSASGSQEMFTLSGSVVNSATGEGVPRAMVRTNGVVQRTTFTDNDGHFQIDGMPQSQVTVTAQKPGFFNDQDNLGSATGWIDIGPNSSALTIRLLPQSAIYGRVTDAAGLPIEHMPLHLTARSIRDGRRRWEPRGMTETDEDGHFRFAGLTPGIYYVAAGPREGEMQLLAAGERQKSGFPHVYYPGVPDFASASPIQLTPGQQGEVDFSLSAVPVYQISGSVSGHLPDQGVGFVVLTASGDELSLPTNFNMETGIFTVDSVPAGSYLLRAVSQAGIQPLRAEVKINVAANLDNVRLALAPAVSIPIVVRMDSRASSGQSSSLGNQQRPPISVHLIAADPTTGEAFSTYEPGNSGRTAMALQAVESGTYTVELQPQVPWYAQSATYGQTNVLTDDISVAPGQSYPLEITLRDDSATVAGTVKSSDGAAPHATIVVVPQPASKVNPHILQGVADSFTATGLPPGDYLIFAFDRVDGLEYSNPDVVQTYASQASHVTLTAGQKAQVSVDLIHIGKGD